MAHHRSIRHSLTLWYALSMVVIMLLFSSFIYFTIRTDIFKDTDRQLLSIAESLASPTMEPFSRAAPSVFDQVMEDFLGPKIAGKYVQLLDSTGVVTAVSRNLHQHQIPIPRNTLHNAAAGKITTETIMRSGIPPMRLLTYPVHSELRLERVVQVGISIQDQMETLQKLLLIFYISIPLGILIVSSGGWFLAGHALRPVELITRSAQKITAENLSQRLVVMNPDDEIGRLAETFNGTLARLEASFIRTRRFFTDISHELRTPLTIIRGEAEVGLKWAKEPEEFREIMRSTMDEVQRMSGIIESLMELSRAEEGGLSLDMQELELGEFLGALTHDLNQQLRLKDNDMKVNLSVNGSAWVMADMRRLRQIFLNLLDNALKHSPSGSSVQVGLDADGKRARVEVIDQGEGIPAEDLPHIFERFYRVDKSRNRSNGGSGLGLSLVKSLAELHGGKIHVKSISGHGSTFTVELPQIPESRMEMPSS